VTDVFISYSREDKDFVRELHEALEERGKDAWVDWADIPLTAEWLAEVYSGIESADTFVFVISPNSVESKYCNLELAHAAENNKRLIPVVRRDVEAETVPAPLAAHNWIFFRQDDDFDEAFRQLLDAIETDLGWVRAHTRLLTRAIEWENSGQDTSFLLRGSDLRAAEALLTRATEKEPKPTALQTQYALASRADATRHQRITLAAVTLGLIVAVILGVFALLARNDAIGQRNEAERQSSIALGRQLTAQAQLTADQEPQPLQRSVLLAIEARRQSPLPSLETDKILRDAFTLLPRSVARLSHDDTLTNITNVAFSPNGEYVATVSSDKSARLWNLANGEEVARLAHEGYLSGVAFDSNSERLATVGFKGAYVWDIASGEEIAHLSSENSAQYGAQTVAFNSNGKYLLTVEGTGADKTVRQWDIATGKEITHIEGGENVTLSPNGKYLAAMSSGTTVVQDVDSDDEVARIEGQGAVFSPDGEYLAASAGNTARVWNLTSGEESGKITQEAPAKSGTGAGGIGITGVALSPDGKYLVTSSPDKTARMWDTSSGEEVARITHEDSARHFITKTAFSTDGKYLATTGADGFAHVWDVASTREFVSMPHKGNVGYLTFSPAGKYLATANATIQSAASENQPARVWDPATGNEVAHMSNGNAVRAGVGTAAGSLNSVEAFSPDGKYLATASDDNAVHVWDPVSGEDVARMEHDGAVNSLTFSPDGKYLATASDDKTARVWDPATGSEVARMAHDGSVVDVAFSPDGKYLATAGRQPVGASVRSAYPSAWVWDPATGNEVAHIIHDNGAYTVGNVVDVAFSPDGKYLATAGDDKTARVWDPATGSEISRMSHDNNVRMVAFSPDGEYLATAEVSPNTTAGTPAHVWDPATGSEISRMNHDDVIRMIAFSPDGKYLATASDDKTARVWDPTTGSEVARMDHDAAVAAVAFSPDGKYLASASADEARAWRWRQPEDLTDEACARLTRNFTKDEWRQYLNDKPYRVTCPNLPEPE
jgi:WD40 repeat protein